MLRSRPVDAAFRATATTPISPSWHSGEQLRAMLQRRVLAAVVHALALSGTSCTTEFDEGLLDSGPSGCGGCFDGVSCQPGDQPVACGRNNESCMVCTSPAGTCEQGSCVVDARPREP